VEALRAENDVTPIDYIRALTPLAGSLTAVGITALTTDYQKTAIKENSKVRIVEAEQDGRMWDVLSERVSDSDVSSGVDVADPAEPADPGVEPAEPAEPVEPAEPTEPTDPVDPVDPAEPVDDSDIDCSLPQFSPSPC
jgi:hypothetical protein